MKYDRQSYFKDYTDEDIPGMLVLETSESMGYRILEKRGDVWCKPYWMDSGDLELMENTGFIELVGTVSSEQFMRVCQEAGITAQ